MTWEERDRIWNKTMGIAFFLFLKAALICFIGIMILSSSGCDQPYLPWNAGPSWSTSGGEVQAQRQDLVTTPQREPENFCEDNAETVESYRRFLESSEPWHSSPEVDARRRQYARQMVEEYDQECNQ